jgi:RNA polymerase sigma-70 factor, ECF subfamily
VPPGDLLVGHNIRAAVIYGRWGRRRQPPNRIGPLAALSDPELLEAMSEDASALGELFRRHPPTVRGWSSRQTGDLHLANDITAETFAQAFLAAKSLDPTHPDASVAGWLYGIAANLLRYWMRRDAGRAKARQRLGLSARDYTDGLEEVHERLDAQALVPQLNEALHALPAEQRLAVWARVVSELSYPEAAALLRCSEQTLRKRVSRGLRGLRNQLEGAI